MSTSQERVEVALKEAGLPTFKETIDRHFLFTYKPKPNVDYMSIIGGRIVGIRITEDVCSSDVLELLVSVSRLEGGELVCIYGSEDEWVLLVDDSTGHRSETLGVLELL